MNFLFNSSLLRCLLFALTLYYDYSLTFFFCRVSSFPYGAGGANESMYSQQSNLHNYMDGAHGNASQNQMFGSYSAQGSGHPGSIGLGVSPQAIGVAQQAQFLQPGQAASQRVPISHTTRASPITVGPTWSFYNTLLFCRIKLSLWNIL